MIKTHKAGFHVLHPTARCFLMHRAALFCSASAGFRSFQNSLLVCMYVDRGITWAHTAVLGSHGVYSQTSDTHKHTLVLAGDTAAHCLLVKDCSHDSTEQNSDCEGLCICAGHAKTLTSMLEFPLWECRAFRHPSPISDSCCRHFCPCTWMSPSVLMRTWWRTVRTGTPINTPYSLLSEPLLHIHSQ